MPDGRVSDRLPARRATDGAVARVLCVALLANLGLAAGKIAGGRFYHSFALEADGWHSLGDGLTSAIALVGLAIARRPADAGHPYGHRKFEVLAACAIGILLVAVAGQVLTEAFHHTFVEKAHTPIFGIPFVAVLASTLAVNLALSIYESRAGARLGSPLLLSDAQHARADCFITAGILASALLTRIGWQQADLIAAVVVALLIGKAGVDVITSNLRYLTDSALVDPRRIEAIVTRVECVRKAHYDPDARHPRRNLRRPARRAAGELSVTDVDRVLRLIEHELRARLDSIADIVIHPEPNKEQRHGTAYAPV